MIKNIADIKQGDKIILGTKGEYSAVVLHIAKQPNGYFHIITGILGDIPAHVARLRERFEMPPSRRVVVGQTPLNIIAGIGSDHPMMEGQDRSKDASYARLRQAYCVQQPPPIPDQAALVWRCDLMDMAHDLTHKQAYFDRRDAQAEPKTTCCNHNCDQGRKCPRRVTEP